LLLAVLLIRFFIGWTLLNFFDLALRSLILAAAILI